MTDQDMDAGSFKPGQYAIPLSSERTVLEAKSPPLGELQPHRDRNLKVHPARYTGSNEAELEWARLWPKVWLCAGRLSDVAEVGSWFQFRFGREAIIVVRSAADEVSALFNVCQHRGHQLVNGDFGSSQQFICGYHSWRYKLNGELRHITDRRYFKPEALCGKLDMTRLRCETWGGFVFVNMDPDAIPLREYLGPICDLLEPYGLDSLNIVKDTVVDLACNWKTVLDAFSEAYHVHATHPELMRGIEDKFLQHDFYPRGHSRQWVPIGVPSRRLNVKAITDVQEAMLVEAALDPEEYRDRPDDVRRAIQMVKRRPDNPWKLDYSQLTDAQLTDSWTMNIFPNLQLIAQPEGFLMQRYLPDPDDPNRCRQHIMALSPPLGEGTRPPAYLGVEQDADLSVRPVRSFTSWDAPDLQQQVGLLLWQDVEATRKCQEGMRSRGFEAVRYSEQENRNLHQHAELDRYLRPDEILVPA